MTGLKSTGLGRRKSEIMLTFVERSKLFPEQYDVFYNKHRVAHARLAYDTFLVYCPDIYDTLVFQRATIGRGYLEKEEKHDVLDRASCHIYKWLYERGYILDMPEKDRYTLVMLATEDFH